MDFQKENQIRRNEKNMSDLKQYLSMMIESDAAKIVISKPDKNCRYKKIVVEKKAKDFQISKYTEKQVFHENVKKEFLCGRCGELIENQFRQVNGFGESEEHIILISKKGVCNYRKKKLVQGDFVNGDNAQGKSIRRGIDHLKGTPADVSGEHNRRKNYILKEGTQIAPLTDMGVFTKDGKVINAMYDKYRQINRFIEILDDEIASLSITKLNVIDFGCGKSYLTFVVYYYLTQIKHIEVNMIGLDLKADVIKKCNEAAERYKYSGLKFELGDINGFKAPFDVDMVITLHACDTATDYALYNAIQWNAKMIFSVPCCQHELNGQIAPKNLSIMSHYGIIKERFSALATDAIRGNLLEYSGYRTQLLEFIDFDHTPKNILIRAVRRPVTPKGVSERAIREVRCIMEEFGFKPALYELLKIEG